MKKEDDSGVLYALFWPSLLARLLIDGKTSIEYLLGISKEIFKDMERTEDKEILGQIGTMQDGFTELIAKIAVKVKVKFGSLN